MFRRRVIGSINISNKVDMTCGSKTYNGETQVATNITVTFKGNTLTEGVDYIVTENNGGVNVGSYVVKIKGIKKYSGEEQGTFSITKVTPTVTAPTPINNLVYNASAQALINAGSTNFGTLKYSLDNSTYSTSIPSGTNATSYTVYYKVDGDSNVNNVSAQSISNSIAKVTPTVVAPVPNVLTYNGTAQELVTPGSTNFGTLKYKVGSSGTYSTSIPTRTRGGAYTVYYKVDGDSNINDVPETSVACSINEKPVTAVVTVSPSSYTYSGSYCEPTVTAKDGETVIDPSEYTVVYSNNLNAGTATVTIYDVVGGDYYVTGSTTFEIAQKAISIPTPTPVSRAYNGNAATATFGSATGAGITKYRYSTNGSSWTESTTNPSQTNAGTLYTQAYYKANDANYSGEGWSNSATIAISKANQSAPTATGATTTYHNTATATASGGGGQGTLTWTNGNTRSATGSQDTYAYWAGNSNYNASPNSNKVTLTVNKATDQSITVTCTNRTYNTSGQVVATATSHGITNWYLGFGSSSTSAPSSWGSANSSISQTNAGTYYIWYKGTADGNHSADISATYKGTVTISKADQSAPTATGATTTYNTTATATASGGGGQGSIEWSNGNTQTSVGSKTTKARWSGNSNYNASPYSNEVTVKMNKADQSAPTATGATVTYGNTATATASGGGGQGSLEWSNGNTRTAVGSQTTKARWTGNGNYNASSWSNSVTLTVNDPYVGHDYVEIGGLKWATMNVGATSVTDAGLYFQWGDTQGYTASQCGSGSGKKYFGWVDYKYGNGTSSPSATGMTKYNSTDGKTVLEASDDAVIANWGGSWRMPTTAEYVALDNAVNTAWTADYQGSGVAGMICTDKTDSSKVLFFPACGCCYTGSVKDIGGNGYYWASSLHSSGVQYAYFLDFRNGRVRWNGRSRCYGFPVRGVVG